MKRDVNEIAQRLLNRSFDLLTEQEKKVVRSISERIHISRNAIKEHEDNSTFGQRVADKVASFGGSWTFLLSFLAILLTWIGLNTYVLTRQNKAFDPYPYILLNLVLSMVAALQAPVIMMSQNRQTSKDRADAAQDYEVNLKTELEIISLHQKIDALTEEHVNMLKIQKKQLEIISEFAARVDNSNKK